MISDGYHHAQEAQTGNSYRDDADLVAYIEFLHSSEQRGWHC